MTFLCIHRSVSSSAIFREADEKKYKDPQPVIMQREGVYETSSPKWDVSIKFFSLGIGETFERGARKNIIIRVKDTKKNKTF